MVDSDDWVNKEAYIRILETLYELLRGPQTVDLLISNFVYEKQGATRKKVMQYRRCLPQDRVFGWEEVKHMPKGKYLLMHSMIYRTKLLHECGLELPKHTFYVDNLFAFEPLPYVKNLYYLDVNFYRYFIGRDDQSVNEKVMIKRIDQQIRVNKLMVDAYINCGNTNKRLKAYMFSYLDIITQFLPYADPCQHRRIFTEEKRASGIYQNTKQSGIQKITPQSFWQSHESSGKRRQKDVRSRLQDQPEILWI